MLATTPKTPVRASLSIRADFIIWAQRNRLISTSRSGSITMPRATLLASGIHSGLMACFRASHH